MDFELSDHGSIALIRPLTDAARDWCSDNLPDDAMTLGDAYAVEPRYAMDIAEGFIADGLTCAGMNELEAPEQSWADQVGYPQA